MTQSSPDSEIDPRSPLRRGSISMSHSAARVFLFRSLPASVSIQLPLAMPQRSSVVLLSHTRLDDDRLPSHTCLEAVADRIATQNLSKFSYLPERPQKILTPKRSRPSSSTTPKPQRNAVNRNEAQSASSFASSEKITPFPVCSKTSLPSRFRLRPSRPRRRRDTRAASRGHLAFPGRLGGRSRRRSGASTFGGVMSRPTRAGCRRDAGAPCGGHFATPIFGWQRLRIQRYRTAAND